MGELANALAVPRTFEFKGKVLSVSQRTIGMQGLFEIWLEGRALDKLRAHKARMTLTEYEAAWSQWQDKCATGAFSWGGLLCHAARFSEPGLRYMAYLQLKIGNPEVEQSLVDDVADNHPEKWNELLEHVMGKLDPNPPAPPSPAA